MECFTKHHHYLDWLALHLKFGSRSIYNWMEFLGTMWDKLQIWGHAHIAWSVFLVRILNFFLKSSIFFVKNEI